MFMRGIIRARGDILRPRLTMNFKQRRRCSAVKGTPGSDPVIFRRSSGLCTNLEFGINPRASIPKRGMMSVEDEGITGSWGA